MTNTVFINIRNRFNLLHPIKIILNRNSKANKMCIMQCQFSFIRLRIQELKTLIKTLRSLQLQKQDLIKTNLNTDAQLVLYKSNMTRYCKSNIFYKRSISFKTDVVTYSYITITACVSDV